MILCKCPIMNRKLKRRANGGNETYSQQDAHIAMPLVK